MMFALWFIIGFIAMEPTAWALHKYLFHGPLWILHRSHHVPSTGGGKSRWRIESNDAFSLIFAGIAMACMAAGGDPLSAPFAFGFGVTAYGFAYFFVHDIFVHRRVASIYLGIRWMAKVREAHRYHHRSIGKVSTGPFGLFLTFDYGNKSGSVEKSG